MTQEEISEFARILVQEVRDVTIRSNDATIHEEHLISKRWKAAFASSSPDELLRTIIPDVVDSTIGHLLGAIDQGVLQMSFKDSNGKIIDLTKVATELGELSGWYRGVGGWCGEYSKERVADDFSDLDDFFK